MKRARAPLALTVDIVACDGRGICAEVVPERVTLDDWGYPMIDATPLTDDLEPAARRAVNLCPKLALRLQRTGAVDPLLR